jgi:hypothetical protein
MMSALKDAFQAAETWPEEDQEALVEAAREIEAQRTAYITRRQRSLLRSIGGSLTRDKGALPRMKLLLR